MTSRSFLQLKRDVNEGLINISLLFLLPITLADNKT